MEYNNRLFSELRPFYTQKDINDAIQDNKLFFFDVGYFCGYCVEHDGYSKYYASIDETIEAAYNFAKKYEKEMVSTDRRIHFRTVKEVIPRTEILGNGYIIGVMAMVYNRDKDYLVKLSLNENVDFCLEDFINKHDDVVSFEEIENVNAKVIRR